MSDDRASPLFPAAGWHAIVAGNGPSLLETDRRCLDPAARIIRVNNFFFEDDYLLGRRVDLVQVGGDRWVFPFYAKTLSKLVEEGVYEVGAWSCHQPHIASRGGKRLPLPFVPFSYRDEEAKKAIEGLCRQHGKTPTTGILAVINAHALGAERISLCGFDFYEDGPRYAYARDADDPRILKGSPQTGYNTRFHSRELDLDILRYLADRRDLVLLRTREQETHTCFMDLAPENAVGKNVAPKESRTRGWTKHVGLYPASLMRFIRHLRQKYIELSYRRN